MSAKILLFGQRVLTAKERLSSMLAASLNEGAIALLEPGQDQVKRLLEMNAALFQSFAQASGARHNDDKATVSSLGSNHDHSPGS